ncbi:NAD(P)H-dependent oxidoreductase [Desulfococcaceae bacterium OttesenSCG-928-F15]|nr:NAD(P)H-dependent oxidoreductase [Desulfococcaceae bacterium OttesenSCG-928-F15]
MKKISVLGICGSLRKASANMGLLRFAQQNPPENMEIHIADLSEIPFYNQDISEKPASVLNFFSKLEKADALLLACPEYNYSMAPALKNALDWASREPENHLLSGKTGAILGAGGGMGTSRAQYHLRQSCVYLNIHLLNNPEFFSNFFIPGNFNDKGDLISENLQKQLKDLLKALQDWHFKLNPA